LEIVKTFLRANFHHGQRRVSQNTDSQLPPSDEDFDKIYATMQMLNAMLDVESPFTIIAHDPIGEVAFKPSDNVVVEYLEVKNEKLEAVSEE